MIQQAFQHRSARVIALGRAILASFFALAVWIDPGPPRGTIDLTFLLLAAYTLFAALALVLTWQNWWIEARLSPYAHGLDLVFFTLLVFLTEGYISPFFSFFVFLVLSAAIRDGWRDALITTALLLLLFFAAGFVAMRGDGFAPFEVQRFVVRGSNLVVLSLMIVWFGINQPALRGIGGGGPLGHLPATPEPPIAQAMAYVADRTGAGRIVFVWSESEEPWLNVWSLEGGVLAKERLGPDAFPRLIDQALAGRAFLFDSGKRRALTIEGERNQPAGVDDAIDAAFRARFHVHAGLAIPIRGHRYDGEIFALEVPGLCADDLRVAGSIAEEVAAALERTALFVATEETAANRARLHLARDLHDSVVQAFAGMALKLRGLRDSGVRGALLDQEIEELQAQLAQEQRDLRSLIAGLRGPANPAEGPASRESLALLAGRLGRQWSVRCALRLDPPSLEIPAALRHDVDQLVREAVANAVRHGGATEVAIDAAAAAGELRLSVSDNGRGFPIEGEFADPEVGERRIGPRSLYERVHALGGTMRLASSKANGSMVAMALPVGA